MVGKRYLAYPFEHASSRDDNITQRLRAMASAPPGLHENLAIIGALRLYLDLINLFLMLLRIFGGGRRN